MSPIAPPALRRRVRGSARKLLLVPVLAAGLTVAVLPASAGSPTSQGVYSSQSSQGQAPTTTPAEPPANGRPFGVQTGRRPR